MGITDSSFFLMLKLMSLLIQLILEYSHIQYPLFEISQCYVCSYDIWGEIIVSRSESLVFYNVLDKFY